MRSHWLLLGIIAALLLATPAMAVDSGSPAVEDGRGDASFGELYFPHLDLLAAWIDGGGGGGDSRDLRLTVELAEVSRTCPEKTPSGWSLAFTARLTGTSVEKGKVTLDVSCENPLQPRYGLSVCTKRERWSCQAVPGDVSVEPGTAGRLVIIVPWTAFDSDSISYPRLMTDGILPGEVEVGPIDTASSDARLNLGSSADQSNLLGFVNARDLVLLTRDSLAIIVGGIVLGLFPRPKTVRVSEVS